MSDESATLIAIVEKLGDWCAKRPVRLCVLFGSQATGKAHVKSDVDLAVWPGDVDDPLLKLSWINELEPLLEKDVSLVLVSAELNPVLGNEIVRDGRLVFESEKELWARERSRLWHAYNDSLPFRRALREEIRKFVREARDGS
jgi:predicted nucleotidyltransferase